MMIGSQCLLCANYRGLTKDASRRVCLAFRDGIPVDLLINRKFHDKPYEGDGGIRFAPIAEPEGEKDRPA